MNPKIKALAVGSILFGYNLFVTLFRDLDIGNIKAVWTIWAGFSWNFFAYGFDKRMLPWQFVELKGKGEGNSGARTFAFWFTAAIYLTFLGIMAFAD